MNKSKQKIAVIVPNLNGERSLVRCIDSLLSQTLETAVVIVDNSSSDNSIKLINKKYDNEIILIENSFNKGFSGGVNDGIKFCINAGFDFVGLYLDKNFNLGTSSYRIVAFPFVCLDILCLSPQSCL